MQLERGQSSAMSGNGGSGNGSDLMSLYADIKLLFNHPDILRNRIVLADAANDQSAKNRGSRALGVGDADLGGSEFEANAHEICDETRRYDSNSVDQVSQDADLAYDEDRFGEPGMSASEALRRLDGDTTEDDDETDYDDDDDDAFDGDPVNEECGLGVDIAHGKSEAINSVDDLAHLVDSNPEIECVGNYAGHSTSANIVDLTSSPIAAPANSRFGWSESRPSFADGNFASLAAHDNNIPSESAAVDSGQFSSTRWAWARPELFSPHYEVNQIQLGGKITVLVALLREFMRCGDKTLIFSRSLPTLDYLQDLLKVGMRVPFFRLDGATKADDRAAMIAEFNRAGSRPQVFLLSTQAGGEGVNLIGANRTVLFDVSFNPCADGQVNAAL